LELARKSGDVKVIVRSLNVIGHCLWRQNRLDEAEATFRQGLAALVKFPSPRDEAAFYNNLGIVAVARGHIDDARIDYEKAMATFDLTGDRSVASTVLGNLSLIAQRQRNYARSEALTLRQLQISREMGEKEPEAFALTNYALALYAANKEPEAIATVNQAIALSEQIHQPRLMAINHSNLVTAYARLGDLPKAREHLAAAEAIGKEIGDPEVDSRFETGRAYLRIREGKLAEAEQALDRAEKLKPTPTTVVLRGRLAYARGDYRNAARLASQAKAMDQEWYPQYEAMLRAFEDAASTGRPSSIRFEEGG
jgi:tetratricopeptide (TPR) repeat protein